jgi:hypothetical protein
MIWMIWMVGRSMNVLTCRITNIFTDMLDEFSATKIDAKEPVTSGPGKSEAAATDTDLPDDLSEEDFAKQLQAGMADLLGGLDSNVRHILYKSSLKY